MTFETLPEQEPTPGPVMADSAGEHIATPVRRSLFSLNRPQLLKRAAVGVGAICILAPGLLSLVLYLQMNNMAIRLNSLEAAFRSGQFSQLSSSVAALEKHVAEQDERLALKEGVVSGMKQLGDTLDGQISDQNKVIEHLNSQLEEQKKALQDELNSHQTLALEFSSFKSSLDVLKAGQAEKPATASTNNTKPLGKNTKVASSKKSHRSARTVPLVAPFTLTGIEQRGGQMFAVIAPRGATTLSQMQLLSPGDSAWGWQLRSVEANQAVFSVNGIPQRLTAQ